MDTTIKPIKKPSVYLHRQGSNLYLGSSGFAIEIEDAEGRIEYLLGVMDGTKTIDQIHAEVQRKYPDVTLEDVDSAIQELDSAELLENKAFTPDGLLDEYELARWGRNIMYFGSLSNLSTNKYQMQYDIKSAKVTLLGIGGLGSHILYDLVAMGVKNIRAVDFDRLEISNLNRQILYSEADIGRPKADLAVERIRAFSPRTELETVSMRINSVDDVLSVIRDRDYVICVADRPELEIISWVNQACVQTGAVLITGGLNTYRGVYWSMIPGVTGCAECWRKQVQETDAVSAELLRQPEYDAGSPSFVSILSVLTGHMLGDFVRFVTKIAPPISTNRLVEIDFRSMETQVAEVWERLENCEVCGQAVPAVEVLS